MSFNVLQYNTINWLRFPLMVLVVFGHCAHLGTWEMIDYISQINYLHLSGINVYHIGCFIVSYVLPSVAVPCFFIFSGFLFFYRITKWNRRLYVKKAKRRIKSQVIPYILWNIIAIVAVGIFLLVRRDGSLAAWMDELQEHGILHVFWNYYDFGGYYNIFGNPVPGYCPYNAPLWFLRDLIMLVLLSPAVYYFIRYAKLLGIVILGICYCTQLWIYTAGFSIEALFFFALGAYFSIRGRNMIAELRKGWLVWPFIAVVSSIIMLYYKGINQVFLSLFIIAGTITTINMVSGCIERGWITTENKFVKSLSQTAFFIYVTHSIFLMTGLPHKFVNFIFRSDHSFFLMVKYLMVPTVCVGICMGLYYVASKITPKLLRVLTGR